MLWMLHAEDHVLNYLTNADAGIWSDSIRLLDPGRMFSESLRHAIELA